MYKMKKYLSLMLVLIVVLSLLSIVGYAEGSDVMPCASVVTCSQCGGSATATSTVTRGSVYTSTACPGAPSPLAHSHQEVYTNYYVNCSRCGTRLTGQDHRTYCITRGVYI